MSDFYSVLKQSIIDRDLRSAAEREEVYDQARRAMIQRAVVQRAAARRRRDRRAHRRASTRRSSGSRTTCSKIFDDDGARRADSRRPRRDRRGGESCRRPSARPPPDPDRRRAAGRRRRRAAMGSAATGDASRPARGRRRRSGRPATRSDRSAGRRRRTAAVAGPMSTTLGDEGDARRRCANSRCGEDPAAGWRSGQAPAAAGVGAAEGALADRRGRRARRSRCCRGDRLCAFCPAAPSDDDAPAEDAAPTERDRRAMRPTPTRIPADPLKVEQTFTLFDGSDPTVFASDPDNPIRFDGGASGGGIARISSTTGSSGARAIIGPGLSARLAGRTIRVAHHARARRRNGGAAGFRFAYQSGVAISHWQTAKLTTDYATFGLIWRVPSLTHRPDGRLDHADRAGHPRRRHRGRHPVDQDRPDRLGSDSDQLEPLPR